MPEQGSIRCPYGQGLTILKDLIATETDECVLWPYGKRANGYGVIDYDGHICSTHIVAWALANNQLVPSGRPAGNTKDGLVVRHSCDVRACINPKHLLEGTQKNNLDDMTQRG